MRGQAGYVCYLLAWLQAVWPVWLTLARVGWRIWSWASVRKHFGWIVNNAVGPIQQMKQTLTVATVHRFVFARMHTAFWHCVDAITRHSFYLTYPHILSLAVAYVVWSDGQLTGGGGRLYNILPVLYGVGVVLCIFKRIARTNVCPVCVWFRYTGD